MRFVHAAIAAAGILFAAPVFASPTALWNLQGQYAPVLSQQYLSTCCAVGDLSGAANAVGNGVGGTVSGTVHLMNNQTLANSTRAWLGVSVPTVYGALVASASAWGNSAAAAICCGTAAINSAQYVTYAGHTGAAAVANIGTVYGALDLSAAAIANDLDIDALYGHVWVSAFQGNAGTVDTLTALNACCVNDAAIDSLSIGNAITLTGAPGAIAAGVTQHNIGAHVHAQTAVYSIYGSDVAGTATAAGNQIVLDTTDAPATLGSAQSNTAEVAALSTVTLDQSWNGLGVAAATASGNSLMALEYGDDLTLATEQYNAGTVSAVAVFDGGVGDTAIASATAYGNMVSGFTCASCGDAGLSAHNTQINNGSVTSYSAVGTTSAGAVFGTSTAMGNAATYRNY